MGISLRGATSGGIGMTASPQTLTLPVTTNAGDCIIVASSAKNSLGHGCVISGAGATWTHIWAGTNSNTNLYIGIGATAGNTTITATGGGTTNGNFLIAIFSGVLSLTSTATAATGAGNTPVTTGALTGVTVGSLLVGDADSFANFTGAGSWSSGDADAEFDKCTLNRYCWGSWAISSTTANVTFTSPTPTGGNGTQACAAVLAPVAALPPSQMIGRAVRRASDW